MINMFLNEIAEIDYAAEYSPGKFSGGSYQYSCIVNSDLDSSTIKKNIKWLLTHKKTGIDHKIWLLPEDDCVEVENGACWFVDKPSVKLCVPKHAISIHRVNKHGGKSMHAVIDGYLNTQLGIMYPEASIQVKSALTINHHLFPWFNQGAVETFRFIHGVKNSPSLGEQNLMHGHLSFITPDFEEGWVTTSHIDNAMLDIRSVLDQFNHAVLLWRENVTHEDNRTISVEYETDLGYWKAVYDKTFQKLLVLEEETTVENLTTYFGNLVSPLAKKHGISRIYFSEGLSKGSFYDF